MTILKYLLLLLSLISISIAQDITESTTTNNSIISMVDPYSKYSNNEMIELYKYSCEQGHLANCYQLAQKYKAQKNNAKYAEYLNIACSDKKAGSGEKYACDELNGIDRVANGSSILLYGSLLLVAISVFLISSTIAKDEDQYLAQEKLEDAKYSVEISKSDFILKYSRPFFRRYFSPIVSGTKYRKILKEKYRRSLAAAGLTEILLPEDFFAFKLFLIIGFPIIFLIIRIFLEADWSLFFIPLVSLVGFFYPDVWLSGKQTARKRDIMMNMPFSVDMLALSVEAGLDFIAAMSKVIEKSKKNALAEEFELLIKEIKIGSSRAESLRNMAWRVDMIQISSFCATLIAADSVGASIGPILKSLSVEIRQKKSAEIEKAGATAATKILIPMIMFILPAVGLIVFAPMILEFFGGNK